MSAASALSPVIIIPARMASTRLPGKPLADINGFPMIVQVVKRALETDIGPVIVACSEQEVAHAAQAYQADSGHPIKTIMTDPNLPSGSDRIFAALSQADPDQRYDTIINLQGDLPTIDTESIKMSLRPLSRGKADISTLVTPITEEAEKNNPNIVKAAVALEEGATVGSWARALYFSRQAIPHGDGPLYHHIGLYSYRRQALSDFINAPVSVLEKREKLEQLRALENGLHIDAVLCETAPLGVDTAEDLDTARRLLA